jgi:SAM-dependent methyltransferase
MNRDRTAARISLDRELANVLPTLPAGVVLDVGSRTAPYRSLVPATEYLTLDIDPAFGADVVGDIHDVPRPDESFDTIICTEVLEHCRDPKRVVDELRRLLRPGGVCVLSTRFLYLYHPTPKDYFRFTADGLSELFKGWSEVEIRPLGSRLEAAWMLVPRRGLLWGWLVGLFDPLVSSVRVRSTKAATGYLVRASK